jgi:hypothetical protein
MLLLPTTIISRQIFVASATVLRFRDGGVVDNKPAEQNFFFLLFIFLFF